MKYYSRLTTDHTLKTQPTYQAFARIRMVRTIWLGDYTMKQFCSMRVIITPFQRLFCLFGVAKK